jgi:hypothetical protein
MAVVQIADIYNPLVFAGLIAEKQLELNKFIVSGVAMADGVIQSAIAPGGTIGELTNYQPLGTPEPNYSDDVPTNIAVPNKIVSEKQKFRTAIQNQVWSSMNISREIALQDPISAITEKIAQYWATSIERRIINTCMGVLANNIASFSSDMVKVVGNDSAGAVTDAERISANAVLDTMQTMGDHSANITTMAIHSNIYTRLQKQNLIAFIPNARGEVLIPTYLGKMLVVDDSLPAIMGTNRIMYTCILFGDDVIGLANGRVTVPSELFRAPSAGTGGGQDFLYSRRNDVIHPKGFSFLSASVAGQTATLAELKIATNWTRIWSRKNIPLAFLQVND